MNARGVIVLLVPAGVALAGGAATGATSQDDTPKAPIPRVCWFSDYEHAKLSNRCDYHADERRWYIERDGETVPADEQELPPANLCLYFHGARCPDQGGGR